MCSEQDVPPIPENSIVFRNAEKIQINSEMVNIAWEKFKDKYTSDLPDTKYISWETVFNRAVKENWLKLWWTDSDGNVQWTSNGQQAKKIYGGDS